MPRYLSLFGELALEMLAEGDDAQVVHMHCRTGYPDRGLAIRLPGAYVVGVDGVVGRPRARAREGRDDARTGQRLPARR